MNISRLAFLLLLGVCFTANGQDKQLPDSVQPLMPVVERHRNPDYVAPDAKQPGSRRTPKRPKISGEYAVQAGPDQAATLTRYTERATAPGATAPDGIQVRISPDAIGPPMRWLVIGQQSMEINNGELSLCQGLFGSPRLHDSLYGIRP